MTLALVHDARLPNDPALLVVSDAAGRMRVSVEWVRGNSRRAVAVEEAVAKPMMPAT
jgi:manganese/zinc-transporting P-type ATPase C